MKTLTSTLTVALALGMIGVASSSAEAGGCHSRRVIHHAPRHIVYHEPIVHKIHKPIVQKVIVEKPVYVPTPVPVVTKAACFKPYHPTCIVVAGDTWYTIAQRLYGNPALWPLLAQYNQLAPTAALQVGQTLQMPTINQNGTFQQPTAPAGPQMSAELLQRLQAAQAGQMLGQPAPNTGASLGLGGGLNFAGLGQMPNLPAATAAAQPATP